MNLPNIRGMPPAVRAGAALAGGGGVLAALAIMRPPTIVLVIIAVGVVLVGLMLIAYKALLKMLEKRKAAPMERALAGNSASAPTSINNPARRARLDDMRKAFESGVEKFKDAGKNIYSLPWYVLVGEPGSGKTEAIRHCNVGFPPGLQDQLQGVGGTINMNWWFTNYAVILDTAGRLMFEEVEPGTTSEWQEFLKLLRKVRPNCPVNGMLLVIPAESLIRDTADAIERKAGKIAQQLDAIQRALGVRFPVYVVVTKCDLINGFREFFDDLTDPQLQHQMLGWSNPASLDEPFNPEQVEEHLRTVQQRLVRRRMALLQDPVHTEDASKKRTEQVDALYAFPDALMKIAPRLRRYLEMIFVAGEWSQKPLFLRGIYFTSSMREGSALDADLAEALGMPVESLPEGRVWERERAYFLRDLFMNKVFRERGLVTRAINTTAQMRKRRSLLYGTAGVGALLVGVFSFLGWRGLSTAVSKPSEFWAKTRQIYVDEGREPAWNSDDPPYLFPIAHPEAKGRPVFYYDGMDPEATKKLEDVPLSDRARATIGDFPAELMDQARRTIGIPWVYKPVAAVTGFNVSNLAASERAEATAALFERSVIGPLVDFARAKLASDVQDETGAGAWSSPATGALRELIGIEAGLVARTEKTVQIAPLVNYVLRQEQWEKPGASGVDYEDYKAAQANAARQVKGLQDVADWLYDPKRGGQPFPPPGTSPGDLRVLSQAFDRYSKQIGDGPGEGGGYKQVRELIDALKEFADAEGELHRVHAATDVPKAWDERYARVRAAGERVNSLISVVENRQLSAAFNDEFEKYRKLIEASHDSLLERFAPVIAMDGTPDEKLARSHKNRMEELKALHDRIRESKTELARRSPEIDALAKQCAELDVRFLKTAGRADFAFRQRLEMYATADAVKQAAPGELDIDVGALPGRLDVVEKAIGDATARIEQLRKAGTVGTPDAKPADDLMGSGAYAASEYASKVGGGLRRVALLDAWADALLADGGLEARAAALAQAKNLQLSRPLIPLTRASKEQYFNPAFQAQVASLILADCARIDAAAKAGAPKATADRAERVRQEAQRYAERYVRYWTRDLADDLAISGNSWAELAAAIKVLSSSSFNTPLNELCDVVIAQLKGVPGLTKTADGDPAQIIADAEAGKRTIASHAKISSGQVFSEWKGLGENSRDAAGVLRAAMRNLPAFEEKYLICAAASPGQAGGNIVERFWENFCYAALKALADRALDEGNQAFGNVKKSLRFPVVLGGGGPELTPAEVDALKLDVEQAAAIGGRRSDGAPSGAITCERFRSVVTQLQGAGALGTEDQVLLDRVREVVAGLPEKQAFKCRISTVADRQLAAGERPINDPFIEMAIVAGQQVPANGKRIRGLADFGEFNYPEPAGMVIHLFKAGAGGAAMLDLSVPVEGSWSVIRLLNQHEAERSATDPRVWFVKLGVTYNNEKFYMWLKLEMERELPELKKWRQLMPAP